MLQPPRLIRWILLVSLYLLVAMGTLRALIFWVFAANGTRFTEVWDAFLLGLRFDLRVVATLALFVLALGSWRVLSPFRSERLARIWVGFWAAAVAGLGFVYTADFLHFRYLNQRLNATVLGFLEDAGISFGMAWQSYPLVRLTLLVLLNTALGAWVARRTLRGVAEKTEPTGRWRRAGWWTASTVACVISLYGRLGQYPLRWSDAFDLRSDFSANLALNPVQSFLSSLSFRGSKFEIEKVRQHYARMAAYLGVAQPDAERLNFDRIVEAKPRRTPPNVVLVICESFSAYKSSMWGNPLDTTPFFNELCAQGIFFDNCFTPHFGTARGIWSTVTGIPDVEPVKTASRNPTLVDQHSLIEEFKGYEKYYFLGGSSSWANIRGLLSNNIKGLRLYEEGSYRSPRVDVWGISDKNLFLEANEILKAEKQPFFAVIQTAGNHRPYTIAEEDLVEFKRQDVPLETLRKNGFESVEEFNAFRYTDYSFRKFIEAARSADYFDNTLFVFIGDHGIGGNAGESFPEAWTQQGLTAFHVPLLFYAPKLLPAQRISSVASMVDLMPTLAPLAGVAHRNRTLGRDLLKQQTRDGGRSNVAFVIDHNNKTVGAIADGHYLYRRVGEEEVQCVWADFRRAQPAIDNPPSKGDQAALIEAFFETSRYLLFNNRKPTLAP
ncbi:MAG TPA: sulfatase-like hydrolase/transferase [Opitutaceae bacterium]|nr:sulfatase-like hydrolase/transferase [Opitutaceae bacterium]